MGNVNRNQQYINPVNNAAQPMAAAQPVYPNSNNNNMRSFVFHEKRLGFNFKLENGQFTVIKVHKNLPAYNKGVRVGMKMMGVTDKHGDAVQGRSPQELAKHLEMAPRPVTITMNTSNQGGGNQ